MRLTLAFAAAALPVCQLFSPVLADDAPRPIPVTRPAMKEWIEDVKVRTPRIPLPELTDEERQEAGSQAGNYETRLRRHYLQGMNDGRGTGGGDRQAGGRGAETGGGARGRGERGGEASRRDAEPNMTLDNAFKVELFWIVSRANNCQYCLGHQESKLLAAGLSEDRIAALDCDWSKFTDAERAAYAFARKFSFEPHLLNDADIAGLKQHYTDMQILEMILSMSGNNSINRWKEGVGVPQRADEGGYSRAPSGAAPLSEQELARRPRGTYLTPTSPEFESLVSIVAPLAPGAAGETSATLCDRPPLEAWDTVLKKLQAARQRESRLPLVDEAEARRIVGENWDADAPLPNWVRLLANFPRSGVGRINSTRSADEHGDLSPLLKAQLSWITARQDRAWYALGRAEARLRAEGQSDEQIQALDGDWSSFPAYERTLFVVAKNLAASPVVLTDAEVAEAVEAAGPRDVVQTVQFTTTRAAFNRFTEAAGLPLEP
ncbi:MAG: hypothetical protein KF774_11015 [Planctomyces sp.]|nr:hypothetical protein [Planctomyces sp.]